MHTVTNVRQVRARALIWMAVRNLVDNEQIRTQALRLVGWLAPIKTSLWNWSDELELPSVTGKKNRYSAKHHWLRSALNGSCSNDRHLASVAMSWRCDDFKSGIFSRQLDNSFLFFYDTWKSCIVTAMAGHDIRLRLCKCKHNKWSFKLVSSETSDW